MSEQKFCNKCKHYGFGQNEPKCCRVVSYEPDIVYGRSIVVDKRSCYEIRSDESSCGGAGKFFEEKEPVQYAPVVSAKEPKQSFVDDTMRGLARNPAYVFVLCVAFITFVSACAKIMAS